MQRVDFLPEMPKFPFAQCRDIDNPDIFFPSNAREEAESLPVVRALCGNCIHRKECLDYAIAHRISHGIWGGLLPQDRGERSTKRDWSGSNRAKKIRKLIMRGVAPETVAREVGVTLDYVKQVVKRARNKGEIQSDQSNETQEWPS